MYRLVQCSQQSVVCSLLWPWFILGMGLLDFSFTPGVFGRSRNNERTESMARGLAHAVAFGMLLQLAAAFRAVPSLSRPARAAVLRVPIVSADAATTAEAAAAAVADGGLLNEILTGKPFEIQYMEVFDPSLGTLQQPSGVAITPSGWAGLVFIALFQLLSPAGIVQYSKRLRDDEQAWLDEGKCKTSAQPAS